MPANSIMPKPEALSLPAPASDDAKANPGLEGATRVQQGVNEFHLADRSFHAALARFSGGISPVALLLAYTDWLSHLAASPQRQLEISQEAVRDANRLLEASQRSLATGQGPWSLIKPQAQDRRFARAEWETTAVQSAGTGISANTTMVA
jgi:polyhydroxyalkanoate synthase